MTMTTSLFFSNLEVSEVLDGAWQDGGLPDDDGDVDDCHVEYRLETEFYAHQSFANTDWQISKTLAAQHYRVDYKKRPNFFLS